jgi:hypothetical protein
MNIVVCRRHNGGPEGLILGRNKMCGKKMLKSVQESAKNIEPVKECIRSDENIFCTRRDSIRRPSASEDSVLSV